MVSLFRNLVLRADLLDRFAAAEGGVRFSQLPNDEIAVAASLVRDVEEAPTSVCSLRRAPEVQDAIIVE